METGQPQGGRSPQGGNRGSDGQVVDRRSGRGLDKRARLRWQCRGEGKEGFGTPCPYKARPPTTYKSPASYTSLKSRFSVLKKIFFAKTKVENNSANKSFTGRDGAQITRKEMEDVVRAVEVSQAF